GARAGGGPRVRAGGFANVSVFPRTARRGPSQRGPRHFMQAGKACRRVLGVTAAAVAISLGAVSAAQAATVTVGFPFTQPHNEGYLGNNGDTAMVANTTLSEPGANVASPVSGTIIQWRAGAPGAGGHRPPR